MIIDNYLIIILFKILMALLLAKSLLLTLKTYNDIVKKDITNDVDVSFIKHLFLRLKK